MDVGLSKLQIFDLAMKYNNFGYNSYKDINWNKISFSRTLSEDFIREFKDKVDWHRISKYQELSEDFIREFKDKVDWHRRKRISLYQTLSKEFKL